MTKWLKWSALALLPIALAAVLAAWLWMRGSLPTLSGQGELIGLSAPATVQRDALGVVTIEADNEIDAMRALGYVHAQERYFEMDLMRRTAAGELSELFGARAIDTDRKHRVHRMRARATERLEAIAGNKLLQLEAYTEGVNDGLAALDARPWQYLLLGQQPQPWLPADSILTGYAMYFDLQDSDNARELALIRMQPHLPEALFALLTHDGSSSDAPIEGQVRGDAVLPGPAQLDLRAIAPADAVDTVDDATVPERLDRGSNNFAVAGELTRDGRSIIANDMHLGLRAPNIWFRARLRYGDGRASGGQVDVSGFTLPGLPAVIVGSNGHVAWGFTNSYGDWLDWKREPPCDTSPSGELRCPGTRRFTETIRVAGAPAVDLQVDETDWGPVLHREEDGTRLALRWVAHVPGALSLEITDFARATSLESLFGVADRVGMPAQNLVAGDSSGRIAWRLLGPVPERGESCRPAGLLVHAATAPQAPSVDNAEMRPIMPCAPWTVESRNTPAVVDPASARLWTANARVVDGAHLAVIGDGGYALGARARQIRDLLFAKPQFTERDLLAIQLDDRALLLQRWWELLQARSAKAQTPALSALAAAAKDWEGRASTGSAGYRIVRAWRLAVHERIEDGLTAPAKAALGEDFEAPRMAQLEGIAWPMLMQRPPHLLPPRFASWDSLLEDAADEVREELGAPGPLEERSWGERNTAAICHPLAGAIPLIGKRLLCMPREPLRGDTHMPLVAAPGFGASQRMVVAPGFEQDGIIHMPGGQSGHPLSPFWGAGHHAWVEGEPTPFLPGPVEHTLRLLPEGG
ncbi:MAG: penicillin acylase family protein [Pseudomonadota bacterium]|nr:penicillin acylase family protein [Pseudomonadota bacterium]